MDTWFNIDLKEETRLDTVSRSRITNELIVSFFIISCFTGMTLYLLCVRWLWAPLSMLLLCVVSFLAIRNIFIYLLPPPILRKLQKKARTE